MDRTLLYTKSGKVVRSKIKVSNCQEYCDDECQFLKITKLKHGAEIAHCRHRKHKTRLYWKYFNVCRSIWCKKSEEFQVGDLVRSIRPFTWFGNIVDFITVNNKPAVKIKLISFCDKNKDGKIITRLVENICFN